MNKIILSSAALHRILYQLITPLIPEHDDYEVKVKCIDKNLSFGKLETTLNVESKSNWEIQIRIGQLRKLFRLITKIKEQPLVISFESNGYIEIFSGDVEDNNVSPFFAKPNVSSSADDKGILNGKCNITSCQKPKSATWYNHSTRKHYCPSCASRLNNDEFNKRDAMRMFGHDLCTEVQ